MASTLKPYNASTQALRSACDPPPVPRCCPITGREYSDEELSLLEAGRVRTALKTNEMVELQCYSDAEAGAIRAHLTPEEQYRVRFAWYFSKGD